MSGELLTPAQVAKALSIEPSTLAQWRYRGEGPAFIKVGKRAVRYDATDLATWIDSQREGA